MGVEVQSKLPVRIQAITCLTSAICAWALGDVLFHHSLW